MKQHSTLELSSTYLSKPTVVRHHPAPAAPGRVVRTRKGKLRLARRSRWQRVGGC